MGKVLLTLGIKNKEMLFLHISRICKTISMKLL
jgi:hypothetical protein